MAQMAETSYYRFDDIEDELATAQEGRRALFKAPDFTDKLKQRLDELLDGGRVLSLDVFDTLILRDNSSEITRFFEVGGRMADVVEAETGRQVSQVDAFIARQLGTEATYRASRPIQGCREGSIVELHRTASQLLVGSNDLAEAFIAAELENEATRIGLNTFIVDYVASYRASGGAVVLVTDMYLHAEQVVKLLEQLGIARESYDALFSSADTKVSKSSGGIFPFVERNLVRSPGDFVHLGDSFRGDVAQPLRRGWKAMHLPLSEFDVRERQRDHRMTQAMLAKNHGFEVGISMPR
ncbi:MAG: HAD family hydrolase [Alphaproteobacteria bacterium HGW-Alphaproteobacteria-14]|nr:MAG: HAD family hydrolase [Alphaproteobacteria bacterium HGW-Alphaproteobacteria-14]